MKCWASNTGLVLKCRQLLGVLLGFSFAFLFLFSPPLLAAEQAALPELLHAQTYHADVLPAGTQVSDYWISEKLDGVRAIWDGNQLRFRSGQPIPAPSWFTQGFTSQPMDGELWLARGRFDELSGLVRQNPPDDAAWRNVKYMLFDLPGAPGTFTERIAAMKLMVADAHLSHLQVIEQARGTTAAALQSRLYEVIRLGGEGLMLHRADALYQAGRNEDLLKFKPWDDAEAVVVAHLPGKGKYASHLGALRVRLPDGRLMNIGSGLTDAQRANPPPIGATITYRYRGLTRTGLPRFATFLRVRNLP